MGGPHKTTDAERFFRRVQKVEDGCWDWAGYLNPDGYGRFPLRGRHVMAQRFSCALHHIHIRRGEIVYNTCGNRACVNPDHIGVSTRSKLCSERVNKPPLPGFVLVRHRTSDPSGRKYRIQTWTTPKRAQKLQDALRPSYKVRRCTVCSGVVSHFYTRAKYCSKACRAVAYAKLRKPRGPCRRCGKEVPFAPGQTPKRMYCSPVCRNAARGEFLMFVNPYRRRAMLAAEASED